MSEPSVGCSGIPGKVMAIPSFASTAAADRRTWVPHPHGDRHG